MQNTTYETRSDLSVSSSLDARRELGSYLAECKKALRKNDLDRDTARYIASEIHVLEAILS